jgi:hypothetical protein
MKKSEIGVTVKFKPRRGGARGSQGAIAPGRQREVAPKEGGSSQGGEKSEICLLAPETLARPLKPRYFYPLRMGYLLSLRSFLYISSSFSFSKRCMKPQPSKFLVNQNTFITTNLIPSARNRAGHFTIVGLWLNPQRLMPKRALVFTSISSRLCYCYTTSVSFRVVTAGGGGGGPGGVWGGADEPLPSSGVFRNQSTGGGKKISPTETNGHQTSM